MAISQDRLDVGGVFVAYQIVVSSSQVGLVQAECALVGMKVLAEVHQPRWGLGVCCSSWLLIPLIHATYLAVVLPICVSLTA